MPDITCPECGQVTTLATIRRAADEFCPHCDYPLFWAPSSVAPIAAGAAASNATLRRLPGAGGRVRIGTRVCPECGELNPMGEIYCIRCTAELDPKPPEPEPPPPPPRVVAPPPPPPPPPPRPWWPWAVLAALFIILTVLVLWWAL
jgi:uncharacterized paraquat-inducible protein A